LVLAISYLASHIRVGQNLKSNVIGNYNFEKEIDTAP